MSNSAGPNPFSGCCGLVPSWAQRTTLLAGYSRNRRKQPETDSTVPVGPITRRSSSDAISLLIAAPGDRSCACLHGSQSHQARAAATSSRRLGARACRRGRRQRGRRPAVAQPVRPVRHLRDGASRPLTSVSGEIGQTLSRRRGSPRKDRTDSVGSGLSDALHGQAKTCAGNAIPVNRLTGVERVLDRRLRR